MSTQQFRPLKNLVDRWLGPLKTLKPAAPAPRISQAASSRSVHPDTLADKGPANTGNIKTFGTGKEGPEIYGAMKISKERAAEIAQETQAEALKHEKEMKEIGAPILSYQRCGSEFGSQSGGLGITDPSIVRGVQCWEAAQRALLSTLKAPLVTSTSPIKTFQN